MTRLYPTAVLILFCLACERSAPDSSRSAYSASSTQTALTPGLTPENSLSYWNEAPDSSVGAWNFAPPDKYEARAYFAGSHVRQPSGLLTIWFDTATRASEYKPVGRAHTDSVVVRGLQHGELLAIFCNSVGQRDERIVGVVRDTAALSRPRLAWLFDAQALRIRTVPTDSIACGTREETDVD